MLANETLKRPQRYHDRCKACNKHYQNTDELPRVLPCSHIICSACIADLIQHEEAEKLLCPWCGESVGKEKDVRQFPVSVVVIRFLNSLSKNIKKKMLVEKTTEFRIPQVLEPDGGDGLAAAVENKTEEVQETLEDAANLLVNLHTHADSINNKIKAYKKQQRHIRKNIDMLRSLEEELVKPVSAGDLCATIQDISDTAIKQARLLKHGDAQVDDIVEVEAVRAIFSETRGCYAVFRYPKEKVDLRDSKTDENNSNEAVPSFEGVKDSSTEVNTFSRTRRNRSSGRRSSSKSRNFTKTASNHSVTDDEDGDDGREEEEMEVDERTTEEDEETEEEDDDQDECYYAKISIDGKYLLMHSLEKREHPPEDMVEEFVHSDLMRTVQPADGVVFLDLTRNGAALGRVYIKLEEDTVWSRHFQAMCAGQCKLSYRGVKLVPDKGMAGTTRLDARMPASLEKIKTSIVNTNTKHAVTRDIEPGLVAGLCTPSQSPAYPCSGFSIYTKGWEDYENVNTFGNVVGGFGLIEAVVKCRHGADGSASREIKIVDTGVMLNLI